MPAPRLFLIDAHALCYRAFYAIKDLRNHKGQATNAVYGFVAALKKILREYRPEYAAVCFDMKGKTRRQQKFAEYKIQRPSMPEDLSSQIPIIREVVSAYRIPILEREGYEADDVIATLARRYAHEKIETVIVSDDKDLFQLVGPRVKVLHSRHEGLLDTAGVEEVLGFPPRLIPDYLALAGDQVDNIPGVKGIGEVSAKKLLKEYGSLKKILSHIHELQPERVRKAVEAQADTARLSYDLALLEDEAPLDLDIDGLKLGDPDSDRLRELFVELEFKKFAAELGGGEDPVPALSLSVSARNVSSNSEWSVFAAAVREQGYVAVFADDSTGEDGGGFTNVYAACRGEVIVLGSENRGWLDELLQDTGVVKVVYDLKDQCPRLGVRVPFPGGVFDVLIAGYLVSAQKFTDGLTTLAWEFLQRSVPAFAEMSGGDIAALLSDLHPVLSQAVEANAVRSLLFDLEIPLAFVLLGMENEGVNLDLELLDRLSRETAKRIDALTTELYRLAGEEFNVNSPKQLSHILFEKLRLPAVKKTKTGYSTDEGVLSALASRHDLPRLLLEYRQLSKLKSTYIDALPKLVNEKTGRIHTTFHQLGAETGRLSSSNPNLQNIPIRTELGRQIRAAFIPSKGRLLLSADYSQIELRILAHLSGDENLRQAFERGEDIHAYTAAQVFDVAENAVDALMRNTAKRVNFGIIYGMGAFSLAKDLGISQREAQDFIDRYFARYPKVKAFLDGEIVKCKKQGFVTTILNRRRYIPEIKSANVGLRQFAERQAINTPVQGSAADMIKLAMVRIAEDLLKGNFQSRMIITVHDELVFDVLPGEEKRLCALVRERMENSLPLDVPIVASLKTGQNWLEMEKVA